MLSNAPDFFALVDRYWWQVLIAIVAANGAYFWLWFRFDRARDPALRRGDTLLVLGALALAVVPFLPFTLGHARGDVATVWQLLQPDFTNPFVTAFFVLMFVEGFAVAAWVRMGSGAGFLARHLTGLPILSITGPTSLRVSEGAVRRVAVLLPFFYAFVTVMLVLLPTP